MTTTSPTIGDGAFSYESIQDWAKLPEGWNFVEVSGVTVDSADNVYVMNRGEHPICVFDKNGNFLRSFGEGEFSGREHGIHISPDGFCYLVEDAHHARSSGGRRQGATCGRQRAGNRSGCAASCPIWAAIRWR